MSPKPEYREDDSWFSEAQLNALAPSARLYQLPSTSTAPDIYTPVPADYAAHIPDELKTLMEFPGYTTDTLAQMKALYHSAGGQPSNTRYGWVRI
jgi:hypothetical protein